MWSERRLSQPARHHGRSHADQCPGGRGVPTSRRQFLTDTSLGFGWLAFAGLAAHAAERVTSGLHFPARAKHVIFLFMDGGVSHVDSFYPKPELNKRTGQAAEWKVDKRSLA
ncbi:MAG: DUF1501 domain-containing protein, partial [Planctomycetia bacterium]